MNNQQLKELSKKQIEGNILILLLTSLIIGLISGLLGGIPILSYFVIGILSLTTSTIYLNLTTGKKSPELEDITLGLPNWKEATILYLLITIFTSLWSLLFVVPGIIKSISYSMAWYILIENPGMTGTEAIDRSMEMMEGHKMDYFLLCLSFIGWILLMFVTCGIAAIYVTPYMNTTLCNFYNTIKGTNVTYYSN